MTVSESSERCMAAAAAIIDDAWREYRRSPFVRQQLGEPLDCIPEISEQEAERRSRFGSALLARIAAAEVDTLPHDALLNLRLVRFQAEKWAQEANWYWRAIDPLGIGYFGLFAPTAYCGGWLLNILNGQLAATRFEDCDDCDRYLGLVADYGRLVRQFAARTRGQEERGMHMPKPQVLQARALIATATRNLDRALQVAPERLGVGARQSFCGEVQKLISVEVEPAFHEAAQGMSDSYLARASDDVGIGLYEGGHELYGDLVKLHTTRTLAPEQVHAEGLTRMARIEDSMRVIRKELGFKGDHQAFLQHVEERAEWRADTVEGVTAFFQRYIDRLSIRFKDYFAIEPKASYGVAPLSEELQGSMTFGYYCPPRPDNPRGTYLFNSLNMTRQSLLRVGALTYHELVPGHHLHFATQQENKDLHEFRRYSFVNAFNEGWAEYATAFAGEIGMYEQPEERYGQLINDAFLTSRLVVDTGMNVLGWPIEKAREYMRTYSGLTDAEIATDTVRYSCDIPAQALAYKLGDSWILQLRESMRRALGNDFALKDFHSAVLSAGALPLPDLEWHVQHETGVLKQKYQTLGAH